MPLLSVITPTYNSSLTLEDCLSSLAHQSFTDFELIIADAGSTDKTIAIAKKFKAIIVNNPLKTGEAGKAAALKLAIGKYILLLDSDNILPDKNWLKTMLQPLLASQNIIGSEPWEFVYRKNGGFIERYSALIGANDPYAWYTKNVDKIDHLNNSWPFPELIESQNNDYILLKLIKNKKIPTIGANGTIFRTKFLKKYQTGDYLFDIDIINIALRKQGLLFAKIKTGIIHTYCESSIKKFVKKQTRRISDLYKYKPFRNTNWDTKPSNSNLFFILYSLLIIPAIFTSLKGFIKKPDLAWFFHPLACLLTVIIYISYSLYHEN